MVDLETEEILGPNQQGELRLKSDFLFNGYYKQDSSDCWDADGWYKTGDVVYYDEDRWIYHVDRLREMFKFRQWHIIPSMLESILYTHPSVFDAVVIGKPDPVDGHLPMAIVQLKEDAGDVSEEEIKQYFDNLVEDAKKLRGGLKIVKNLPLAVTGKILKKELKQKVIAGLI